MNSALSPDVTTNSDRFVERKTSATQANHETILGMNPAVNLASRYVEINRDIALLTAKYAANDGTANVSRLVLRAAALQARAHNDDQTVADAMRAFCAEIGQ
jgi:hypothetical protein